MATKAFRLRHPTTWDRTEAYAFKNSVGDWVIMDAEGSWITPDGDFPEPGVILEPVDNIRLTLTKET